MAFREVIEAVLRVKDANRFKAGMDKAARATRVFGRAEERAAAQTELLKQILEKLDKQTLETTAALTTLAHSVDELGDEMVQTAAKTAIMNTAMKKSGSNAVFLGKSWAFWKDRLSLTRSELMTTALTISAYFSPAIVALGSSFAYAALGGGAVAGAGLASLLFGLAGLASVVKPVTDNLNKITKAQDQYNLAVEQYGASSMQASRASAHLYGIIQTQGGKALSDAAVNLRNFKKEWSDATAPARGSILGILSGGISTLRTLTPNLSTGVNVMGANLQDAMDKAFSVLKGPEMQATFRVLAEIFSKSIGPGIQGATNVLIVFGRVIRAAAPWVVKWAEAWRRTTENWKDSTSDQSKLSKFIAGAVRHFRAWWGLAKAVGRVLKTVFRVSKDEGLGFVYTLTGIVNTFNGWLTKMEDTGRIDQFWASWKRSVTAAFDFLSHPDTWGQKFIEGLNKWLPIMMDTIATTLATHGPTAAALFAHAFVHAGAWAQFFTVAYFLKKFGFFKWLGGQVSAIFVGPFIRGFGQAFIASIGGEALAGSLGTRIATGMNTAGKGAGKVFGAAFLVGFLFLLPTIEKELDKLAMRYGFEVNKPGTKEREKYGKTTGLLEPFLRKNIPGVDALYNKLIDVPEGRKKKKRRDPVVGGQMGGIIPPGGFSIVGESGPEMATAGPRGTSIVPLSRNSRQSITPVEIPNLEGAMHITVHSHVNVDKREIGRAVSEQGAYEARRRGGLLRKPYG